VAAVIGVVVLVALVSVALGAGAPEHARFLSLVSGHGWLTEDPQGEVVSANGQTGQVDFRDVVANAQGDRLEVVPAGAAVLLVDTTRGTVGELGADSGAGSGPAPVETLLAGGGSVGTAADTGAVTELVPGDGADLYDIDRASGQIALLDPATGRLVAEVTVADELSRGVVDDQGVLWVESRSAGTLIGVSDHGGTLTARSVAVTGVAPGDDVLVSSVNGSPALLDRTSGVFVEAPGGVVSTATTLAPLSVARAATMAPAISGPTVPLTAPGVIVLVGGGVARSVTVGSAEGQDLGPPVPFGSRIYVPDLATGRVLVLDGGGAPVGTGISLSGPPDLVEAAVQNGSLFVSNPDSSVADAVLPDGTVLPIDEDGPLAPTADQAAAGPPGTAGGGPPVRRGNAGAVTAPAAAAGSSGQGQGTAALPSAPAGATASAGDGQATVGWSAAESNGSAIDKYTVSWSAGDGGSVSVPGGQDSVVVPGLTDGDTYVFTVTATNAKGTGPGAQTAPVVPNRNAPGAPQTVSAQAQADGTILVQWSAADGNGVAIAGYRVTPGEADGLTLRPVSVSGSGLSVVLGTSAGIVVGSTYTFTVAAMNTDDVSGSASLPSSPVTASSSPEAVTGLTAVPSGGGTAEVSWSCDAVCAQGNPPFQYEIAVSPALSPPPTSPVSAQPGAGQSDTISGLVTGVTYTVTVTAENEWGRGPVASTTVTGG
jgi:hypothetical protein